MEEPSDPPDRATSAAGGRDAAPIGGDPFASSLADLEAHVAAADQAGEPVPPEARRMLAQLRELSSAISALSQSLGPPAPDADAPGAGPR